MLNIDEARTSQRIALFNSGFRIFFLAAALFSVLSMLVWLFSYSLKLDPGLNGFASLTWHAHEMIYGYSMAVISGFLLTAVTNWTNRKTLTGKLLLLVFVFWLLARIMPFVAVQNNVEWMFLFDTLFFIMLITGISRPVIKSRNWLQLPIILLLIGLMLTNSLFYAEQMQVVNGVTRIGLYGGFYLVLTLVLIMARRVIPFFIEKGLDNSYAPRNYLWLDQAIIPFFVLYATSEVVRFNPLVISVLAAILFVLNLVRLYQWYTTAIWKKPLLWILIVSYFFITLAFALKAVSYLIPLSDFIVLHSFAVGGVGLLTVGMMARVALGHTGRNVFEPPAILLWIFVSIGLASVLRIVFPLLLPGYYEQWVILSQFFWITAFSLFIFHYAAILINPRLDGRPG